MQKMTSRATDDEIANFKAQKRFKIDEYFKHLMNKIDIKVAEIASSIAVDSANAPTTSNHHLQMENLEKVGKRLVDEIEKICAFNLVQFESNLKEIVAKYIEDKSLEDNDEINNLVFKQFCFLHELSVDGKRETRIDEQPIAPTEESEAISRIKLKLVISDWYLNEKQLEFLK